MSLSFAQLFKPRQRLVDPDVHPAIVTEADVLLRGKDAEQRLHDHDAVTARGSAAERLAYQVLSRRRAPRSLEARRRLLAALPREPSPMDGLEVERAAGVLVTDQSSWAPVAEAVREARACFADVRRAGGDNPGKRFMTTAKLPRPLDSKIMALARHPAVLRLIGRYLDGLPILYRINLLDSANEEIQPDSSQFFHVDPEDFRQLKIFLLVEAVDAESGPLHLLRADASDAVRVARAHRHGRVPDEEVLTIAPPGSLVACTGPPGTLAIGDTSRCFHFGSRPGARRRHVVMIQYLSPFASVFPLDAAAAGSKYADAVRQRAEAAGQEVGELDAYLFGLTR